MSPIAVVLVGRFDEEVSDVRPHGRDRLSSPHPRLDPLPRCGRGERAGGLWTSRQIVARVMDAFGPSLAGTHVEHVDVRLADGRRVVGEWVRGAGVDGGQERSDPGNESAGDSAIYFLHGSGYAL